MLTKFFSRFLLLATCAGFLASCASTQSTVSGDGNKAAARVFLISSEQAEKILATAMTAQFPGAPILRVEFPNKGYQATVRFLLDSHTIVAYMVAAKGRASDGSVKDGFAFEVSNAGTMPLSGGARAGDLFERLIRDASAISPAVPLAGF
jgi:hypothetical protein